MSHTRSGDRLRDVAVAQIAAAFAVLLVDLLDLRKTVVFQRCTLRRRELEKLGVGPAKIAFMTGLSGACPTRLKPYFGWRLGLK